MAKGTLTFSMMCILFVARRYVKNCRWKPSAVYGIQLKSLYVSAVLMMQAALIVMEESLVV